MKNTLHSLLLLLPLALLPACFSEQVLPVQQSDDEVLIESIIKAHGGGSNLKRVSALTAEGQITRFLAHDEGTYHRAFQRPGKLAVEIRYPTFRERRVLNGAKGYRGTDGPLTPVTGALYQSMVYQYDQLDLPFGFIDGALEVSDIDRSGVTGTGTYSLSCLDRSGNRIDVIVDGQTHRITRSTGTFTLGGAVTTLSAEFRDYRLVDGIQLPFHITNYAGGMKISETVISRYEINPKLPEAVFTP